MEPRDFISGAGIVIGAAMIVVGWFVSRWKDRNHEIFKIRLQKRLEMFESLLDLISYVADHANNQRTPDLAILGSKLEIAHLLIQKYGYEDEIRAFKKIVAAIEAQNDNAYAEAIRAFSPLILKNLRKELRYTD